MRYAPLSLVLCGGLLVAAPQTFNAYAYRFTVSCKLESYTRVTLAEDVAEMRLRETRRPC